MSENLEAEKKPACCNCGDVGAVPFKGWYRLRNDREKKRWCHRCAHQESTRDLAMGFYEAFDLIETAAELARVKAQRDALSKALGGLLDGRGEWWDDRGDEPYGFVECHASSDQVRNGLAALAQTEEGATPCSSKP